jgi:polysaccharide export outer membrane protein
MPRPPGLSSLSQLFTVICKIGFGRPVAPFLGLVLLLLPAAPAAAAYIICPGDVLDVSVLGAPTIHTRSPVDPAGQISLPVVGSIDAAAHSVPELRNKIRDLLVKKNIIRDPQVTLEVVEYRPIYVGGDVIRPGAYPYRIGMTVRDALALAGGYDPMHLHGRNPTIEAADARSEYAVSELEIAKQWARLARLKAELSGSPEVNSDPPKEISIKATTWAKILELEQQQLQVDREDEARETGYLTQMVKQTQRQSMALSEEQRDGESSAKEQTRNIGRTQQLLERGLVTKARFEDQQRAATVAQNHLFDVAVRAAQAQKEFEDYNRKLQVVVVQKRTKLLQDMSEANSQLATARIRLKAAAEKLRFATGLTPGSGLTTEEPSISIYREAGRAAQGILAGEDTTVLPGDSIEIKYLSKSYGGLSPDEDTPELGALHPLSRALAGRDSAAVALPEPRKMQLDANRTGEKVDASGTAAHLAKKFKQPSAR